MIASSILRKSNEIYSNERLLRRWNLTLITFSLSIYLSIYLSIGLLL